MSRTHHSSPVNAWVHMGVGCKKQTIFSMHFVVAAVPDLCSSEELGVKSILFNFIFLL